jgi:flagellar assembly factor FliW
MTQLATLRPVTAAPQPVPTSPAEPASISTRFGAVTLHPERLITLPAGLLGFADCQRFALADLPDPQGVFKLLQSVDEPELAFLVLPIDPIAGPLERSDLESACQVLGFDWPALAVLGLVTIRPDPEGVHFSINLKAPLLIDTGRQVGRQHVFAGEGYPLRYDLPRADAA